MHGKNSNVVNIQCMELLIHYKPICSFFSYIFLAVDTKERPIERSKRSVGLLLWLLNRLNAKWIDEKIN